MQELCEHILSDESSFYVDFHHQCGDEQVGDAVVVEQHGGYPASKRALQRTICGSASATLTESQ